MVWVKIQIGFQPGNPTELKPGKNRVQVSEAD